MVSRNTTIPIRFICITDDPTGLHSNIETKPLLSDDSSLKGWWHKLSLFQKPLYDIEGKVLFLDLDVVIVDNIDEFFTYPSDFSIIKEWLNEGFNSSVFRFNANEESEIWEKFLEMRPDADDNVRRTTKMHGDQNWITLMKKDTAVPWPKDWCLSFKYANLDKKDLPKDTKIVIFHGFPKPPDAIDGWRRWIASPWIKNHWK